MFADIAQPGRPQERIGHRVANHVRVGVPDQPERMLDPEPTQDQRPPLAQPMRVMPDPNPHVNRLRRQGRDRCPPPTLQMSGGNRSVLRNSWLSRHATLPIVPMMIGVYVILRRKVSRLPGSSHPYPGGNKFSSKELKPNNRRLSGNPRRLGVTTGTGNAVLTPRQSRPKHGGPGSDKSGGNFEDCEGTRDLRSDLEQHSRTQEGGCHAGSEPQAEREES